jgi:hypothetical protein
MRRAAAAAGAFGLMMLLPTLAEAQLFPNATIKRQRVPCCEEPSVYSLYRRQYYGYYPTCWRRFPPGWGCPSPEAPNGAAAMEEIRREIAREAQAGAGAEGDPGVAPGAEGANAPAEGNAPPRGMIPLPGDERSPFEMPDDAPGTPPAPGAAPGAPDPLPSPFEDTPPAAAAPPAPATNPTAGPGPRAAAGALPPLDVPPPMVEGASAFGDAPARAPKRSVLGGMFASARGRLRR